jgi:hypothetical protein
MDQIDEFFTENPDEVYPMSKLINVAKLPTTIFLYNIVMMCMFFAGWCTKATSV